MANVSDTYFNPVTRTKLVFVGTAASSGGRELAIEWFVPPGERLQPPRIVTPDLKASASSISICWKAAPPAGSGAQNYRPVLRIRSPSPPTRPTFIPGTPGRRRCGFASGSPRQRLNGNPRGSRTILRDPDGAQPARTRQPKGRHPQSASGRACADRRAFARDLCRGHTRRRADVASQWPGWPRQTSRLSGPHHAGKKHGLISPTNPAIGFT